MLEISNQTKSLNLISSFCRASLEINFEHLRPLQMQIWIHLLGFLEMENSIGRISYVFKIKTDMATD